TEVILFILAISLVKALLVALFYMHLKFERSAPLWGVVIFPFFLIGLAVGLVCVGNFFG
ncbi:MAG: cytochrome C oxidase subunit IV family protein, partial [Candidatus Omnitrophica bacterium]|nr:cytochrome C oxidase subunit IV family protein [Candidatus Omnitrophota bacterium]